MRFAYCLAMSAAILCPCAASAACVVTGPPAMYLGGGGEYTIQVQLDRGDACQLNFNPLRPDVRISKGSVAAPAKSGVVNMGGLVAIYVPGSADSDSFALQICGTDIRGTGCNRLTYRVVVR